MSGGDIPPMGHGVNVEGGAGRRFSRYRRD